jgi:hypothetical protein
MKRWKVPSFVKWILLLAVAFLGGALVGALILGLYGYLTYEPDPNCGGLFCMTSATDAAEFGALGGVFFGAFAGTCLWVIVLAAWLRRGEFHAP